MKRFFKSKCVSLVPDLDIPKYLLQGAFLLIGTDVDPDREREGYNLTLFDGPSADHERCEI